MHRRRKPDGLPIDIEVSLLDTAMYLQAPVLAEFLATNTLVDQHELNRRYPTAGVFDAQDGPFMMPWWNPDWDRLCAVLDSPELAVDPRFRTPAARREHRFDLQAELARAFKGWPREHWMKELRAIGVMVGAVLTYEEAVRSEQLLQTTFYTPSPPRTTVKSRRCASHTNSSVFRRRRGGQRLLWVTTPSPTSCDLASNSLRCT
jgi:crotonobetainyl-CoA:carnitine CoA-transferase CaiB-like acyl-CoA transferase